MHITTTYLTERKEPFRFLLFLLCEDYVSAQARLQRHLMRFAQKLGEDGAIVVPFEGGEENANREILAKDWLDDHRRFILESQPLLLLIDVDFAEFSPRKHPFWLISLRDFMSPSGNVHTFDFGTFTDLFISEYEHRDFTKTKDFLASKGKATSLDKVIMAEPNIGGVGLRVPALMRLIKGVVTGNDKNNISSGF